MSVKKTDLKELFENFCFTPDWSGIDEVEPKTVHHHKELPVLLAELEEIKNDIEGIKAKEWHLAKLMKLHNAWMHS
jgi:hypothetical protein